MLLGILFIIIVVVIAGYFACFFFAKSRPLKPRNTDAEKTQFTLLHERRLLLGRVFISLTIIFLTFTPVVLISGLDRLQPGSNKAAFFRLGIGGLAFALASLITGLLYWLFTTMADARGLTNPTTSFWNWAVASFWYEVGTFLVAVAMVISAVYLLLINL